MATGSVSNRQAAVFRSLEQDRRQGLCEAKGLGDLIHTQSGMTTDDLDRMIAVIGAGEHAAFMPQTNEPAMPDQPQTDERRMQALLEAVEQPDLPPGKR